MRAALACALALGGCSLSVPSGYFSCATDEDCQGSGYTCVDGRCGPRPGGFDAGGGADAGEDGGSEDAGRPCVPACAAGQTCVDGTCVGGCTRDGDCDDDVACTDDRCTDGVCGATPVDAACVDGPDGVCDPTDGCQYSACEVGVTCVAAPCEEVRCEGTRCVRTALCAVAETCCEGACVAVGRDPRHCARCNDRCTATNGAPTCMAGVCGAACSAGFADCDGDRTTCETPITTGVNCGNCATSCSGATPVCADSGGGFACASGCPSGQTLCGTSCVDTDRALSHCGRCDAPCDAMRADTCASGACACGGGPACASGQVCCGGRCVPLGTDANCAGCGDTCVGGQGCCTGACIALTSPSHCGACGNVCGAGEACHLMSCCTPDCTGCRTSPGPDGCGGTCAPTCNATTQYCASATTCLDRVPNGRSCTAPMECLSTHCAGGICCAVPCGGTTPACNVAGTACVCNETSCGSAAYCDGGTCRPRLTNGSPCTANTQCTSGVCASFFRDQDADGYGAGEATLCATSASAPPAGYAVRGGDCADTDAARNPGALELCDTIDQDCDGAARNGCPSATATVMTAGASPMCGPGTNGTSEGHYDACPTGMLVAGYEVRTDGSVVQARRAACIPIRIAETVASPEYNYGVRWDGATISFTPWRGNSTAGSLSELRCATNQFVIGFDARLSASPQAVAAFGIRCGTVAFERSGSTWAPRVTATATHGPVGGSGTACSQACGSERAESVSNLRTITAGGPTGILQTVLSTCGNVGYVPQ